MTDSSLTRLRQLLVDYFSDDDLRTLCFDLGLTYDALPTIGTTGKARELILALGKLGRLPELVAYVRKARPALTVDDLPPSITADLLAALSAESAATSNASVTQTATGTGIAQASGPGATAIVNVTQHIHPRPVDAAPHFLVPFPHNPDFVGRDTELAGLHEMLKQGKSPVGIRPTVLVGLGGIGKTQLAVEYAHAHRADYPGGIFWLNAVNPLLLEFADLAEKLDLADRDTPRDKAARQAWEYLDTQPESLVIFDNVVEPADLNVPFSPDLIPANLRCRTLFTTRQRDLPRTFQPFEVKVLPEMAAMRLLLRARQEVLEEPHPEWGWARIVCATLGWLPLALELAAAYLGAYPDVMIEGYLERLRTEGKLETVDDTELRPEDLPTRHDSAVRATLQTQWARLDDADARLLFRAAGQFPEASWIPTARLGLHTGVEAKAAPGHPEPLARALKKLHAVSLIEELTGDRLRLHPLVQEFAARLSPPAFRLELAARVAAALADVPRLQARVVRYGIDMVLEDARTGLGFCTSEPESETYPRLSSLERVLDRQAHTLRGWDPQAQPAFFLQQLCNESLELDLGELKARAEAELARLGRPYLCERFKVSRESPELVRTLTGHSQWVNGVALSADGRLAVSASADKTLKVWNVATGRELRTLAGHNPVALSADGRLAVSASSDWTLKVWDVDTSQVVSTLPTSVPLCRCAITPDGKTIVAGDGAGMVHLGLCRDCPAPGQRPRVHFSSGATCTPVARVDQSDGS